MGLERDHGRGSGHISITTPGTVAAMAFFCLATTASMAYGMYSRYVPPIARQVAMVAGVINEVTVLQQAVSTGYSGSNYWGLSDRDAIAGSYVPRGMVEGDHIRHDLGGLLHLSATDGPGFSIEATNVPGWACERISIADPGMAYMIEIRRPMLSTVSIAASGPDAAGVAAIACGLPYGTVSMAWRYR